MTYFRAEKAADFSPCRPHSLPVNNTLAMGHALMLGILLHWIIIYRDLHYQAVTATNYQPELGKNGEVDHYDAGAIATCCLR